MQMAFKLSFTNKSITSSYNHQYKTYESKVEFKKKVKYKSHSIEIVCFCSSYAKIKLDLLKQVKSKSTVFKKIDNGYLCKLNR